MPPQKTSAAKPLIAITMGDPAGVGPELSLRVLAERAVLKKCTPVVFGDAEVLRRVGKQLKLPAPAKFVSLADWQSGAKVEKAAVIDCQAVDAAAIEPGKVSPTCGAAAYKYIETAVRSALSGKVSAVATCPIHKEALSAAGVQHAGHTEILAHLSGTTRVCMMLTSPSLTVSFATTHCGYIDVPSRLSTQRILDVIELTASAMELLRRRRPRLSVCGLNPHGGEHGLFGRGEEEKLIAPAVEAARAKGINVEGPLPPDSAFIPQRLKKTDATVCMYHDQGHIPFKMLAFDTGVNVTLGLPIVRTLVDHGTAFDIAWRGIASPTSLIQAVLLAVTLAGASGQAGNK